MSLLKETIDKLETVTIPKSEYQILNRDQQRLHNLQAAGVDNWEGYHHAFDGEDQDEESED